MFKLHLQHGVPAYAPGRPAVARPAPRVRSMRWVDFATAMLLAGVGVLVLVASLRMGIGWGSDGPQAGFVPFWLSTILILSCAGIAVRALRARSEKAFVRREQLVCVLKVLLPAAGMIVATGFVGLYVASAAYMALYMRWAGRHSWLFSLALPVAFVLLVFLIFERWFLVPLPKGPVEAWLGY